MTTPRTTDTARGLVVATGWGVKISVAQGHLIVHDGAGRDRRTRSYNRATSDMKRLIVLGHTGYVTFEALRWIRDVSASLIQIDKLSRWSTFRRPGSIPRRA